MYSMYSLEIASRKHYVGTWKASEMLVEFFFIQISFSVKKIDITARIHHVGIISNGRVFAIKHCSSSSSHPAYRAAPYPSRRNVS
jgi:hypothetical protein